MSNWTRAHDAWIARECEGLEVDEFTHPKGVRDWGVKWTEMQMRHHSQNYRPIDNYLTDPAAAIRAAEAWRKKNPIWRHWIVLSPRKILGDIFQATVRNDGTGMGGESFYGEEPDFAAALAQALLRATGGPA